MKGEFNILHITLSLSDTSVKGEFNILHITLSLSDTDTHFGFGSL